MTCIVGLQQDGKVYMGGDTLSLLGYDRHPLKDPKVFRLKTQEAVVNSEVKQDEFLIGGAGGVRALQVLRYLDLKPLTDDDRKDLLRYMIRTFAPAVRAALKEAGCLLNHYGMEWFEASFLVAHAGELFMVGQDFAVVRATVPFLAVGCGADVAVGALRATEGYPAEDRIRRALEAAAASSVGVEGPFTIDQI